jgi:hypothetical protein
MAYIAAGTVERQAEGLRECVLNGTRRGQLGFARREFGNRVLQCFDGSSFTT